MMFRAIVIDDEIWALRGFMNLLDWEKLEIQIIGGYQDEEEALEAIRRERPDIVVTDVYLKNGEEMRSSGSCRKRLFRPRQS